MRKNPLTQEEVSRIGQTRLDILRRMKEISPRTAEWKTLSGMSQAYGEVQVLLGPGLTAKRGLSSTAVSLPRKRRLRRIPKKSQLARDKELETTAALRLMEDELWEDNPRRRRRSHRYSNPKPANLLLLAIAGAGLYYLLKK